MKMPPEVKRCLYYHDTNKLRPSNSKEKWTIIFNVLNYRFDNGEAIKWLQENFTEKEIKKVIYNSYASQWWKFNLKRWADFYKVCPKYKYRMEYILRNDKDKDKIISTIDDKIWPHSGNNIWEEIKKYRE